MELKFNILEYFKSLNWPSLEIKETEKKIMFGDKIIYSEEDKKRISFYSYSIRDLTTAPRYKYLESIWFDDMIDIQDLVFLGTYQYKLSYYNQLNAILGITKHQIKKIEIFNSHKKLKIDKKNKIIKIPSTTFLNLLSEAETIYKKTKKHKTSIENYLTNKALAKFNLKKITNTTYIEKGEFSFLIHRLNLKTKNKDTDFLTYFDLEDIASLEKLTDKLIKKEVFSVDFLRRLDEYLIKEKLEHIIKIGDKILKLRSEDIKLDATKKVYKQYTKKTPKQMESVWQIFFEKYLLYLIFSYKTISPKIRLKGIKDQKKYPDFLGINHYGGIDIIEIKTHLKHALTWDGSHGNFAFSSDLSKAIIQTMNYIDAVKKEAFSRQDQLTAIKQNLLNSGNLYDPRGIIIISSKKKLAKGYAKFDEKMKEKLDRDFTKLRNSLHNIEILTFDEVLNVAKNYTKNIANEFKDI